MGTSRTIGILGCFALLGACGSDDGATASGSVDQRVADDVEPVGDASVTAPCTDTPADPEDVPPATLSRFEAALVAEFAASGTWVETGEEAVSWSHPLVGSPAALALSLDPVSGAGWTWFGSDTEGCGGRLGQTVAVKVRTADGALTEEFDAQLSEDEAGALYVTAQVDLASLTGSLRTATIEPTGATRVLARFDLALAPASLSGTLTGFAEYPEADGQVVRVMQFSMATW